MAKAEEKKESKIESIESIDTNDYKELYNKLRSIIATSKDGYVSALYKTKDLIEQKKEELRLLEIRKYKFEGAIEAGDHFLISVLPNNNKRLGE